MPITSNPRYGEPSGRLSEVTHLWLSSHGHLGEADTTGMVDDKQLPGSCWRLSRMYDTVGAATKTIYVAERIMP